MRKCSIGSVAITAFVAVALSTSVNADGVYKTEHISLRALDDSPLRSGSVTNIHANGPIVYANEQYHLNGADANTTYGVFLEVYVGDSDCSDAPLLVVPTATLTTNRAGNGHAKARFAPADVAGLPTAPAVHGVNWVFMDGETAAYETGCQQVVLD